MAGEIRLVETGPMLEVLGEKTELLTDSLPVQKALRLVELGVEVLVCGRGIQAFCRKLFSAYGIQVVPFVAGELREVIRAWVSGALDRESFSNAGLLWKGPGKTPGSEGGQ